MSKHSPSKHFLLRNQVINALNDYFSKLEGEPANNIYELVLTEVEAPLLEIVMKYTNGNQTKAAEWLGLNRGTLRKLLAKYGLSS
jgi:Fis family transcriptional regulator